MDAQVRDNETSIIRRISALIFFACIIFILHKADPSLSRSSSHFASAEASKIDCNLISMRLYFALRECLEPTSTGGREERAKSPKKIKSFCVVLLFRESSGNFSFLFLVTPRHDRGTCYNYSSIEINSIHDTLELDLDEIKKSSRKERARE